MSMGEDEQGPQCEAVLWVDGMVGGELEYSEAAVAMNIAFNSSR